MKKILSLCLLSIMMMSCNQSKNPFFEEYSTPYGSVPFDEIKVEHFMPAFQEGMKQQTAEIEAIVNNPEAPTFENTIEAMENSGQLLSKVSYVFSCLTGAETNDELTALSMEISPLLSAHGDNISLNDGLFQRVKAVYEQKDQLNLNQEQARLLEITYKDFIRSGAALNEADKNRLREINMELSKLALQFSDNVLKETNQYMLVIDKEEDLAGLPESVIAAAATTAKNKGLEGKWVFTLHNPSRLPFLQYSERRELREALLKAYINRGDNDNEFDNKAIINKMVNYRIERSNLLGYNTFADYALENKMAQTPEAVFDLMAKIWERALPQAKKEAKELQAYINKEGGKFKLEAWDWWYYTEKVRKEKFDLDEAELKPYFKMENVREGIFMVANRLYGLNFKQLDNVDVYHPEVEVFEVSDADGSLIGLFYTDYYPREGKRSGAWMSSLRKQQVLNGQHVHPHIYNVGNFTRPVGDTPALLSIDEVETMFHEFGHALHGLLSKCTYNSLSGTSVSRDFVELPSQIMENWCMHPEVLKLYAKHYETGEIIPDELIAKIQASNTFNQGFTTVELVSAAYLDMFWHVLDQSQDFDVRAFETEQLTKLGLIPEIIVRYRSTNFIHIFKNNYSAGYYSYLWSEVLDADGFGLFEEKGIFDQASATSFRKNVLERGNTDEPMNLYRAFRGADPNPEALLLRRGL
ncbi:MAG: M3 family metallopeptidase [Bacteroidales bacterium]|nr:M3 family metallopeptidase [Bacteroidales bacterium]MBO5846280.1 M3 family metallopeptidase [Bacteroidales bacterium]MBO7324537.1 M3 family metallopeptidase [Bacteroidales bacterium]